MPKKRSSIQYSKPSSPAHPSLSSSSKDASHSLTSATSTGNSVNERIQQLRIEQHKTAGTGKHFKAPPPHAIHPSLRSILQVPDAPPPRPRPGLRVTGGRRVPPGPHPPDSWLNQRARERDKSIVRSTAPNTRASEALPGYDLPAPGSLLDLTLKELARDWDFHAQYDQYYLATIPVRYKELLLRYIALLRPRGIDRLGLETLFLSEHELEDATGACDLNRLDLSTSIGRSLALKDLKAFFTFPPQLPAWPSSATLKEETIPETWDAPVPRSPSLPKFYSLTHLSLSHPPPSITWSALLSLLPCLPPITHLSLAHWPTPTLTPNSLTAYTTTPAGDVQAGGSNFYSAYDNDWSEAASILRRVAKSTLSLEWLDLTGCGAWVQALGHDDINWGGSWAALGTIKIGQGWVPDCFLADERQWRLKSDLFGHGLGVGEVTSLEMEKAGRKLVDWACNEVRSLDLERLVRFKISRAAAKAASAPSSSEAEGSESSATTSDEDWGAGPSGKGRCRTAARTHRLRFERGWEAAWIKEAVVELWEREPAPRGERRGESAGAGGLYMCLMLGGLWFSDDIAILEVACV